MGEHAVGFKHVECRAGQAVLAFEHGVDLFAQGCNGVEQPGFLGDGVVGQQVLGRHRDFVQDDVAQCDTIGEDRALQPFRPNGRQFDVLEFFDPQQVAGGNDLGQHHGDDLEVFDLFFFVAPRGLVLHDQDADGPAAAQQRHAEEGPVRVFACFRTIGEACVGRRVHQVQRRARAGDFTDQTFGQAHARLVDGVAVQAFGGEQFQFFGGAAQIDRTDLGDHRRRDDAHDGVKPRLGGLIVLHDFADLPQQSALAAYRTCLRHYGLVPLIADFLIFGPFMRAV